MRITTQILSLALALPLVSCNGGATADPMSAAETALQAGDSSKAVALLQKHVAGLDASSADYREATLLLCSALAEGAPKEASAKLLSLAQQQPEAITAKDFRDVQSYLQTHGHYLEAIDVMDAGLKRWAGDPLMLEVKDRLLAAVQNAGDAAATAKLKGLGYM